MAHTLNAIFGDEEPVQLPPVQQWFDPLPQDIWANYDAEEDDLIVYVCGKPARGVHVSIGGNTDVIVDPISLEVIGYQFAHWEAQIVQQDPFLSATWDEVKHTLLPDKGWSQTLRVYAYSVYRLLYGAYWTGRPQQLLVN